MPFDTKSAKGGALHQDRTASNPVDPNRKVPNAFPPRVNIVNEFLAINKAESIAWVNGS